MKPMIAVLCVTGVCASVFVKALCSIRGGREAYMRQVYPVVSKYEEALGYGAD